MPGPNDARVFGASGEADIFVIQTGGAVAPVTDDLHRRSQRPAPDSDMFWHVLAMFDVRH